MASDVHTFAIRAALARIILQKLPGECPSWRQTNIQIAGLARTVEKFNKRFGWTQAAHVLGGEISKTKRKAMGDEITRINRQAKKMTASLNKTWEEGFYKVYPHSTAKPRIVRRAMVTAHNQFEKTVRDATKEFRAKVLGV